MKTIIKAVKSHFEFKSKYQMYSVMVIDSAALAAAALALTGNGPMALFCIGIMAGSLFVYLALSQFIDD